MVKSKTTKKVKKATPKTKKVKKEEKPQKEIKKLVKYFEEIGRRKTSTARVRLFPQKEKSFLDKSKSASHSFPPSLSLHESSVNEKPLEKYFPTLELQKIILSPLKLMNGFEQFNLSVRVRGGGVHSQAEAVRHGIAKTLVLFNPDFRKKLKQAGFLTRDPRMRERKKFGLKRARRAPQWQKR